MNTILVKKSQNSRITIRKNFAEIYFEKNKNNHLVKTTINLLVLLVHLSVFSQGIRFVEMKTDSDLAMIHQKAAEEKKLIFIDCYTTWCGPCKYMEKNIFTNDTVAKFYNEHFVCARMDMEKGVGISYTYKYDVYSYPTYLFIDKELGHRTNGTRDVKGFIKIGETALNADKRFSYWQNQYKAGNRNPEFIREYLKQLVEAGQESKDVADWYFASVNENDLISAANFEMLEMFIDGYYTKTRDNKLFDFLLTHKEDYISLAGKERVDKKIYSVFRKSSAYDLVPDSAHPGKRVRIFDEKAYDKLISKIKSVDFTGKDELLLFFQLEYCQHMNDWKNYESSAIKYVNLYLINDFNALNNYAWIFYENENIKSKDAISAAINWAKKALELSNTYYTADTYAAILYKSGNKKEALKAAENAITLGKNVEEDVSATEELLEKIKRME